MHKHLGRLGEYKDGSKDEWKDGPAVTREQSPAFLRNSNGRLDLPGPTQEAA